MSRYTALHDWATPLPGSRWRVARPVRWEIGREGSGLWLVVPVGYVFDVSVPWWLGWAVDPRDARYLKAAALHDWALDDGWDRVSAAAVFADALKADGVGRTLRLAMTIAVIAWNFE